MSPASVVKLVALAVLAGLGYLAIDRYKFLSRNAGNGRPVCMDDLQVASKEAVLRAGVWNYLQDRSDRLAREADPGVKFRPHDPHAPLDVVAVDAFLKSQPDCCTVKANWRMEDDIGIWRTLNIIRSPNIAWVRVVDETWKSEDGYQTHGPGYQVDACWENVRRTRNHADAQHE